MNKEYNSTSKRAEVSKLAKNIYRSRHNRVIAGVCGGIGEHLNADPVLIRLLFAALTVFTAVIPGIIFYFIAWIIIPDAE